MSGADVDAETDPYAEADGVDDTDETDDPLPGSGDPYWDELTNDTFAHLRRIREAARGQQRRDAAFTVYIVVLLGGGYGGIFAFHALRYGAFTPQLPQPGSPWQTALPYAVMALCTLALLTALRTARWRGPVLLDALTVDWLLPLPVRWGRLLRPKFRIAVAKGTVLGAVLGALGGTSMCTAGLGPFAPDLAAGAVAGGALGLLATGASGLVAMREGGRSTWWTLVLAGLAALFTVQAVFGWNGLRSPLLETVELWSGPWGWATRTLLAVTGGSSAAIGGSSLAGGTPAVVLLLACAVACTLAAGRLVPRLSGEFLRTRASTAKGVSEAIRTVDLRQARLAYRAGSAGQVRTRWSPPPPRHPALLVPWRDVVALTGAPARALWGLAWWAGALTAVTAAGSARTTPALVVGLVVTMLCGYLAAAQWVEPARTDADDLRRSRLLPYTYPSLVLRHAVLPTAALVVAGGVGCGVLAAFGLPVGPGVVVLVSAPALVGAALVSANRGSVPQSLFIGADTAMGNTAPVQVVLWLVRAPLSVCGALGLAVFWLFRVAPDGVSHVVEPLALLVATTAVALRWAQGRARKLYEG